LRDTCALVAYLTGEAGSDHVEAVLNDHECHLHSLMVYEFFKDTLRRTSSFDDADELLRDLDALGVARTDTMDDAVLKEAAHVRLSRNPMALPDAFGVAVATLMGWIFLTSDRGELQPLKDAGKPIEFFRP